MRVEAFNLLNSVYYSNPATNIDTATVLQQRVKEIGINVDISVADWPTVSKVGFTDQGWHFWTHR